MKALSAYFYWHLLLTASVNNDLVVEQELKKILARDLNPDVTRRQSEIVETATATSWCDARQSLGATLPSSLKIFSTIRQFWRISYTCMRFGTSDFVTFIFASQGTCINKFDYFKDVGSVQWTDGRKFSQTDNQSDRRACMYMDMAMDGEGITITLSGPKLENDPIMSS